MQMRTGIVLRSVLLFSGSIAVAQPPGGGPEAPLSKSADADDLVARMLKFDQDKDGKLTKVEITDTRLLRLFDRADADKNGTVTKDELTALAAREHSDDRGFGPGGGGPPGFGPGGGSPPGFGPGGRPGFGPGGPMMGPPRPGEVLPPMLQQILKLSAEQKKQLDVLQKDVDAKLEALLNDDQKAQLKEMRERRPGGFGRPGGPGPRGGGRPGGEGPPR